MRFFVRKSCGKSHFFFRKVNCRLQNRRIRKICLRKKKSGSRRPPRMRIERVQKKEVETGGIDPPTPRMRIECSTIWAKPPTLNSQKAPLRSCQVPENTKIKSYLFYKNNIFDTPNSFLLLKWKFDNKWWKELCSHWQKNQKTKKIRLSRARLFSLLLSVQLRRENNWILKLSPKHRATNIQRSTTTILF